MDRLRVDFLGMLLIIAKNIFLVNVRVILNSLVQSGPHECEELVQRWNSRMNVRSVKRGVVHMNARSLFKGGILAMLEGALANARSPARFLSL